MTITDTELKALKPLNNHVIVKPIVDTTKTKYGTLELFNPLAADGRQIDEFKNAPVVCQVVCHPRRLIFGTRKVVHESVFETDATPEKKMWMYNNRIATHYTESTTISVPIPGSMMWKTSVMVKDGDVVWVNANFLMNAIEHGNTISTDTTTYFIMPYENLYLKVKDGKTTMLNGYVLAEPIEDTPEWTLRAEKAGIIVPDYMKRVEFKDRLAIVRYIGDPVEYMNNDRYDHPEIKAGDTVLLSMKVNRRLEPGMKFFAKDNANLIVTRRCNIEGILS